MGALNNPFPTSDYYNNGTPTSANNPNFKGSKTLRTSKPSTRKVVPSKSMSFKSVGDGVAPALGEFVLPAMIASMGLDYIIPKIQDMYLEKMKEAGIPLPAEFVKPEPIPEPEPIAKPTLEPFVAPDTPATTLIDVLSQNGDAVSHNIAEHAKLTQFIGDTLEKSSALHAKTLQDINTSLQQLTMAVVNDTDVNSAYKELTLNDSQYDRDTETAYKDANLSNNLDLTKSVDKVSDTVKTLKDGVKIEKSSTEQSLATAKLNHLRFDTTPIQVDNLDGDIPTLSPQQMRAVKDAVVAKKNSDENSFTVDDSDLQDGFTFLDLEDVSIADIFHRWSATMRNEQVSKSYSSGHVS